MPAKLGGGNTRRGNRADRINDNPNVIDIEKLNSVDRSILKESLLKVRSLQQHLQLDYAG